MQQQPGVPMLDKSDNTSATEHFLVYGYKVVPCSKRYRHDWSVCPFAHTGEMAARRDPSRYIPIFCFHSKQRLPCPRGDECPYSHNLFEYWLHPKRYRTEMCQFGAACTRPVCFFAHGEHQLRHTDMPGGPQPVVAPPEPVPALNGGFGSRDLGSPIDPAVKQQQQLMALQAAAAGFSQQQQHQQQHQQQQAAAVAAAAAAANNLGGPGGMDALGGAGGLHHVGSFSGMVDSSSGLGGMGGAMGGSMNMNGMGGMGGLQSPMGLAASSPLSAPLPQLSPDVLAALQSMGNGNSGAGGGGAGGNAGGGVSSMGTLMHQHSSIPTYCSDAALPQPGRLQRSLTAHPSVNAAAAAAAAADNSSNLNELSKQLAFMQLMQGGAGGAGADHQVSGTLPDLSGGGRQSMDQLLGYAQLQQQQQQQQAAMAAAVAVTAGLDLSRLLPVSSGYGHDGSLSCPLPPVFGGGALGGAHHTAGLPTLSGAGRAPSPAAPISCTLPRIPTAPGSTFNAPTSPLGSDTGRDAPSPVGADGRDTQVPAPSKKGARWSAPVSPSNSSKGGNDLAAAADGGNAGGGMLQHHSSSESSESSAAGGGHGSQQHLHRMASDNLAHSLRGAESLSFSAGVGQSAKLLGATGTAGSGSSDTASSALLMVGDSPLEAAQVQAALSGNMELVKAAQQQQQHGSVGKDKAAQLLAQLPEDAVQKLLALVQQSGGEAQ